ncbi:hypothetical protein A2U01_0037727, partial [Trifolium medium]|nr:hypothetical protein [Trifolium medium]
MGSGEKGLFEVRGCNKIEVVGFGFEEGEEEKVCSKDVGWWEDEINLTLTDDRNVTTF